MAEISTDPSGYLSTDPNAGLDDQYLSTDPSAGLEAQEPSGFVKGLQTAQQALGVAQQGLMGLYTGAGPAINKLLFPKQHEWETRPIVSPETATGVVHTALTPLRTLEEVAFGDRGKQGAAMAEQFVGEQLAGFTSPESLALAAAGGIIGKMPKLREVAFGKPPPVEAMPQTSEPPISETVQPLTEAAVPKVEEVIPNAEQIQGPARANVDVQLPGGAVAREVYGGEMPADVGGERVPPRGQGETLQQTPQEVAPTIISGEYQQGTEFSPLGDSIRRRINTLVDDPRVGNLSHPDKGLAVKISADPQYAYDFARKQAEKYPDEAAKYNKIADFIDKQWPDIQKPTEVAASVPQPEQPTVKVSSAAVKMKDGSVFEGYDHASALNKAYEAGYRDLNNEVADQGFVSSSGKYLNRKEAYDLSIANKEITAREHEDVLARNYDENLPPYPEGLVAEAYNTIQESKPPSQTPKGGTGIPSVGKPKPTEVGPQVGRPEEGTAEPPPPAAPPPVETATADNPPVSRIANRFVKERVEAGEIGEIAPGEGFSTRELAERGLRMTPEEVNQHVSDLMQGGGDPIRQAEAVRGEEARLSQRSAELSRIADQNPNNVEAKLAADTAFKDLTDFHNGPVATLKQNWHAQGKAMQGEIPVDLSTTNGLREQWFRDLGEMPPSSMDKTFAKTAEKVTKTIGEDNGARANLRDSIDKATSRRKLPTPEEVQQKIIDRMKVNPCRT